MTMLDNWREQGVIRPIDYHLARMLIARFGGDESSALLYALVSACTGEGHACLDLACLAGLPICCRHPGLAGELAAVAGPGGAIGEAGDYLPLIREQDRLYLHRYHVFESVIASHLSRRLASPADAPVPEEVGRALLESGAFPAGDGGTDWQRVAAAMAALQGLTIISGGPGTGKTTTVAGLLVLLFRLGLAEPRRVAIAAPTGKAAARLQEAIRRAGPVGAAVAEQTSTIHRLLGVRTGRPGFCHDRNNPLAVDLVVIDEGSMIDVALMARLLDAIPPAARLVLLGDRDQLASVNPGSVFADLCGEGACVSSATAARLTAATGCPVPGCPAAAVMDDHIVELRRSYRYPAASGMARLAPLVRSGRGEEALALLRESGQGRGDVVFFALDRMEEELGRLVRHHYGAALQEPGPAATVRAFERFRIFSTQRRGAHGIERINLFVEILLAEEGVIDRSAGRFYHGRPIIVTANDYAVRLFNGDTGVLLRDPDEGRVMAFFPGEEGGSRVFPPSRLPAHETAFALTVHKAQGSEYDHVACVLPSDDTGFAGRELVYTAITRARRGVTLFAGEEGFRQAVERRTQRMSGLGERLRPVR